MEILSFQLYDNDSYNFTSNNVTSTAGDQVKSSPSRSIQNETSAMQPYDTTSVKTSANRPYYQPIIKPLDTLVMQNMDFDDISPDNMLQFQQLASSNPSELQLHLLVRMQKMLLEMKDSLQLMPQQEPQSSASAHGVSQIVEKAAVDECQAKVTYSSLDFDYEAPKDSGENLKLVLGESVLLTIG